MKRIISLFLSFTIGLSVAPFAFANEISYRSNSQTNVITLASPDTSHFTITGTISSITYGVTTTLQITLADNSIVHYDLDITDLPEIYRESEASSIDKLRTGDIATISIRHNKVERIDITSQTILASNKEEIVQPVTAVIQDNQQLAEDVAATALHSLGLFNGTGKNPDGTPNFDLKRAPTRQEAITMLVRLLGKEDEANAKAWETPFIDVDKWAEPYVGYAYANGLTTGTGKTTFGSTDTITASQYLTFILRALGYTSGNDFQWNKAWELSDQIGLTNGQYNEVTPSFTRGDVAIISEKALSASGKGNNSSLLFRLVASGAVAEKAADNYLHPPISVKSISLNQAFMDITPGNTKILIASITPNDAANKALIWTSSNPSIATVRDGTIKGISVGTTTITASTANGLSVSCKVTVSEEEVEIIALNKRSATIDVDDTLTLIATISPSNATDMTITWKSSDTSVATVQNGKVTGISVGITTITARSGNGKTATCRVTVTDDSPIIDIPSSSFSVPLINHEYGPMTATTYFNDGSYWWSNNITSLQFTKVALSASGNRYQVVMRMKGCTDWGSTDIFVYFYDSLGNVLEKKWFTKSVTRDKNYDVTIDMLIDKDVIENASRIEFFSYDGNAVTSGSNASGTTPPPTTVDEGKDSLPDSVKAQILSCMNDLAATNSLSLGYIDTGLDAYMENDFNKAKEAWDGMQTCCQTSMELADEAIALCADYSEVAEVANCLKQMKTYYTKIAEMEFDSLKLDLCISYYEKVTQQMKEISKQLT